MIVATLDHLTNQAAIPPRLSEALDFLRNTDLLALEDGRVEIQGDEVYALVQSYDSRPIPEQPRFEAHRKYLDVQYLASGTEAMGWASLDQLDVTVEYIPERDILLGHVPEGAYCFVPFRAGQAVLLYPTDAHAPMHAAGEPEPIKKIVVKVLLED
jgi:YhcH/YjgK/YiaL family protein